MDQLSQSSPEKICFPGARKIPAISPSVHEHDGDESGWVMVRRRRRYAMTVITGVEGVMSSSSTCPHAITTGINGSLDPNLNSISYDLTVESLGHLLIDKSIAHQIVHLGHDGVSRNGGRIYSCRD